MPSPRRVRRRPYVQVRGPVWSTLALEIHADQTAAFEVVGASSFPRHWIYGHDGTLAAKTGLIDFDTWYRESFGEKNPGASRESPAVVTAVETGLERELSAIIIGLDLPFRRLRAGEVLVAQGDPGDELYLLFDGVLAVEQDGQEIAEVGPGAILGEMAVLEGRRTATLRAVTRCRVAAVPGDRVDRAALAEVARGRRDGAEPAWHDDADLRQVRRAEPERARFCLNCGAPLAAEQRRGARKVVTVVVCDVTGSTALGERLDPESLGRVMARYFERTRAVLERHHGLVQKFIGTRWWPPSGSRWCARTTPCGRSGRPRPCRTPWPSWSSRARRSRSASGSAPARSWSRRPAATLVIGEAVNLATRLQAAGPGEVLLDSRTCTYPETRWWRPRWRASMAAGPGASTTGPRRNGPGGWSTCPRTGSGTPGGPTARWSAGWPSCSCSTGCSSERSGPRPAIC